MGRYANDTGGGDFKQAAEGTHLARCIQLVDIGTHPGEYEGKANRRNQVIVRWELPGELIDTDRGPEPMIVSAFYTNSLGEKAKLRQHLEAWRGRQFTKEELMSFDLEAILGKPCLVSIVHNDKGKAKVTGVLALPKGMDCPPAVNKTSAFWIDDFDDAAFQALPQGFRNLIADSDEYKAAFTPPSTPPSTPQKPAPLPGVKNVDQLDDDIPF